MVSQRWHNDFVARVCRAAMGDVQLNQFGNLVYRAYLQDNGHMRAVDEEIAVIERDGWRVTKAGARFVLDNWYECFAPNDLRQLNKVFKGE